MQRILALALFMGLPGLALAQPIPSNSVGSNESFSFSNLVAGSTNFVAPGLSGANQNTAGIASRQLTLTNLYIRLTTAPASAQSVVATVYAGSAASMSATALTCTVAAAATTCNDTTHAVVVPQGQSWAIQVVVGATNATGTGQAGILAN